MSYLALYRKYRPSSFDDLVGQTNVSKIIKKEILDNKVSHAYLFSGPRGTGKTSTAKIIAKMLNCLCLNNDGSPCNDCVNCKNFLNNNDIVEIDAASNNGVDEIRELRDKVNLVPTSGKYKIYIIDEVHMLTTQAFNALLKTLEEPPSHIIFILATTELNKIPITVVSRCQKFQFSKFSDEEIVERLSYICMKEKINIDDDALIEISRLSDGGLRDAINMLDQLSVYSNNSISLEDVYNLNGILSYSDLYNILEYVHKNEYNNIIKFVDSLDKNGNDILVFLEDLMNFLKDSLIYINTKNDIDIKEKKDSIIKVTEMFSFDEIYDIIFKINDLIIKLKNSSSNLILLTTFFLNLSFNKNKNDNINNDISNDKIVDEKYIKNVDISENKIIDKNKSVEISFSDRKNIINNAFTTASKDFKKKFYNKWDDIFDKFNNGNYKSIVGVLNDVTVEVVGDCYLIIVAKYDSLIDRLNSNVDLIVKLFDDVYGVSYKIAFLTCDEWNYEKNKYIDNIKKGIKYELVDFNNFSEQKKENNKIDDVVSIFGDEIVEIK